MQKQDIKLLLSFILRTGMYTGEENKYTISSFIHGYETGRAENCFFSEELIFSINDEYNIESKAIGWIDQTEFLAEKLETDWITIFKKQSLKILTKNFNQLLKQEFNILLKKRISGKINGIKYNFQKNWLVDWFGIVDLNASWFKDIWSNNELILLTEIENELIKFGNIKYLKEEIKPTEKLKQICSELSSIIED